MPVQVASQPAGTAAGAAAALGARELSVGTTSGGGSGMSSSLGSTVGTADGGGRDPRVDEIAVGVGGDTPILRQHNKPTIAATSAQAITA